LIYQLKITAWFKNKPFTDSQRFCSGIEHYRKLSQATTRSDKNINYVSNGWNE